MPIERFPSQQSLEPPKNTTGEYHYGLLRIALDNVLAPRGILKKDYVRDPRTKSMANVYTVGRSEEKATIVVLIGFEESHPGDTPVMIKPHKLIAPRRIIDAVRVEYARIAASRPRP